MCPLCYTVEAIFIPPNCRPIRTHLQSQSSRECPEGGSSRCDSATGGGDDTSRSGNVGVYPFTGTRCVGSRWRLRGDTIFIDVCILGCCFGLCSAGARQCSNSTEERVNRDATGIEPNIFDLGIVNLFTLTCGIGPRRPHGGAFLSGRRTLADYCPERENFERPRSSRTLASLVRSIGAIRLWSEHQAWKRADAEVG